MITGKKEKYETSNWILRNLFCCCSNLGNDDIVNNEIFFGLK